MSQEALAAAPQPGPSLVFPDLGTVTSRSGHRVDVSGWSWRLPDPLTPWVLDWTRFLPATQRLLDLTARFMAEMVRTRSYRSAHAIFGSLCKLHRSPTYAAAVGDRTPLRAAFFAELKQRQDLGLNELTWIRTWYRWCSLRDPDLLPRPDRAKVRDTHVGTNEKGVAIRRGDPDTGRFTDTEVEAILAKLRNARLTGTLTLQERVAVWLFVGLGGRPKQLALLRASDFRRVTDTKSGTVFHEIAVPRIKQRREGGERAEFRTRPLNPEMGAEIEALVRENEARFRDSGWEADGFALPLFLRNKPRKRIIADGNRDYALHLTPIEMGNLVGDAVAALDVISPRTGRPLRVTPRRFRYTLGSRMVAEGASPREVAWALDHSDTSSVGVYFDLGSDIVRPLDAATALALAPVAQAFLGTLVVDEAHATRGGDAAARISAFDRARKAAADIGTCGSFGYCGLVTPAACYTCVKFQPWVDGPHEMVLDALLEQRERRRASGQDDRMVVLHDRTILAVADVITRCKAHQDTAGVAP
ncbi:site-specific integrase [Microvirga sp. BT689]|uniref:site-specific integrase n=1 Tax=Microvirga arvi TaxID=2778731 RepID=UPI001951CEA4|nr:site-specific integrase [Microvirga arvi]MBM6581652.1 site-specific integrase [Microvirga arvi]